MWQAEGPWSDFIRVLLPPRPDGPRGGYNKAEKTGKGNFNQKNEAPGRKIPRELPEFSL